MERHIELWERVRAEFKKLGRGGNVLLASRLGKSEAWVSRKMRNKRGVSLKDFFDICEALDINPGSLFETVAQPEKLSAEEALRGIIRDEISQMRDKK